LNYVKIQLEDLGMFILLPIEKEGIKSLNKLEAQLTVDVLEQLFAQMEKKTVSVQLPKFRIQQKLQLKVKNGTMIVQKQNFKRDC